MKQNSQSLVSVSPIEHMPEDVYTASSRCGALVGYTGPMFSDKSGALIRDLRRYSLAGYKVIGVKPAEDTRNSTIVSRGGGEFDAIAVDNMLDPHSMKDLFDGVDVIGIDEGQFMAGIAEFCKVATMEWGKVVIVACLSGNYKQEPFANVVPLYPLFTSHVACTAICVNCPHGKGRDAPYTIASSPDAAANLASAGGLLVGSDDYVPVCMQCLAAHRMRERAANGSA